MSKNEAWEQIGEKLRQLRKEKGLSVHKVGRALGISGNYISEIERGKKAPSEAIIISLSEFYKIDTKGLYEVYGREENRYAKEIRELPTSVRKTVNQLSKEESVTHEDMEEALKVIQQMMKDMKKEGDN